jgi:hypothetical protein
VRSFLETHWGDILALYLLHLGLLVIYLSKGDSDISHVGEGLMATGLVTMRFKGIPRIGEPKL